jgi:signal transduction histidine kinase
MLSGSAGNRDRYIGTNGRQKAQTYSMNHRHLGIVGVSLALAFWALIFAIRHWLFGLPISLLAAGLELAILLSGGILFWIWIARRLDEAENKLHAQAHRLETLHQAGLSITTERDHSTVLQSVVDQSRLLIGARYGALGVLDASGKSIDEFIVSGLDPAIQAQMSPHAPEGHGLLGLPIKERRSVRVDDIAGHPASVGFPPGHPPMGTFLGVPITSKGEVYGHIYLTDKLAPKDADTKPLHHTAANQDQRAVQPFTLEDQILLEMFATQAAIAIENANLYRHNRELAVLRERERFSMDLHDGAVQGIYAAGLLLEDGLHRLDNDPALARERMREVVERLSAVSTDIRRYIHDLRSQSGGSSEHMEPLHELESLAHTLRLEAGLEVRMDLDAQLLRRLTPRQNADLLQIVREACANIRRHAQATRVQIGLRAQEDAALLQIQDNGLGFDPQSPRYGRGHGLQNMQTRAQTLGGTFNVTSQPGQGSTLQITVPFV